MTQVIQHTPTPSHAERQLVGQRTWFYLAATILLLLFIVFVGVFGRELDEWYWVTLAAPSLQRDLGFRTATATVKISNGGTFQFFAITYVQPGGAFERAGFRASDIPSEWFMHGGAPAGFYSRLESSRGKGPVEFKVVPAQELGRYWRRHERSVFIRLPSR